MKNRMYDFLLIIKRNFKTLITFEILFRTLEVLIIFPLATGLLYLSIILSPYQYITNAVFFDYLLTPTTIILILFIALILGFTLVIEMIFLSYIFYYSHLDQKIDLKTLIYLAGKETPKIIKKYHLFTILFSLFFFLAVELSHIVGIATTIQLPAIIINFIDEYKLILYGVIGSLLVLYTLFFETLYNFNIFTIDRDTLKDTLKESQQLLKHKRLHLISEFIVLNAILNSLVYLVYLFLIGLVALFIFLVEGQTLVFGLLLTVLSSIYLITSFLMTITLIPINFAWMSIWYYSRKQEILKKIKQPNLPKYISFSFLKKMWVKRLLILIITIIIIFNGLSLYTTVNSSRSPIQLFNQPTIIAHRGSSYDAPENTIAAIEKAIEDGADAVEIDIRLSKDNIPVLMHDARLGRTTNDPSNRLVSSLTYAELQELDAGSWFSDDYAGEKIPSLEETFIAVDQQVDLFIELKDSNEELLEYIVELANQYNITNNIKILSFNESTLKSIKEKEENIDTVLLIFTFFGNVSLLSKNTFIDHIGLEYSLAENNSNYIEQLQLANKHVYVYTVNNSSDLNEINNLSIDGLITDLPITAREIVYTSTTRSTYSNILRQLFSRD